VGWGQGGETTQALYAHMNNKRKKDKKKFAFPLLLEMVSIFSCVFWPFELLLWRKFCLVHMPISLLVH
jgi:hypothetical protein